MHDTMGIGSVGITTRGPLHEWRFNTFLKDFFAEKLKDIIRCTGVLCVKVGNASQDPRLLHGCVVHSQYHSFVYSGILWVGGEFLSNICCLGSQSSCSGNRPLLLRCLLRLICYCLSLFLKSLNVP